MSKRTLFLIFALFLITFVLLMLALYQPQSPKSAPTVTTSKEPIAQTILSFGNLSIATSSSITTINYSLPININTFKNKATAVQMEMQYDPKILTNITIVPGPFFSNPQVLLNQIDTKIGRISYAFGVGLDDPGVIGKGIIATLTFSVKSGVAEKTAIIFLPKTLVTAQGINESVLRQTINGLFTVGVKPSSPSATIK